MTFESAKPRYKLPYIKDKSLFAAVCGACSYISETGWFNKATQYYADRYRVDVEEVRRLVRVAQGNGQKKSAKKRKYYYFAVEYSLGNERHGSAYFVKDDARYAVLKATSEDNAKRQLDKNDGWGEYDWQHWFGRVRKFDTIDEADNALNEWSGGK